MKDEYNDVDEFIKDTMPLKFPKIRFKKTNTVISKKFRAIDIFEQELNKILFESDENNEDLNSED